MTKVWNRYIDCLEHSVYTFLKVQCYNYAQSPTIPTNAYTIFSSDFISKCWKHISPHAVGKQNKMKNGKKVAGSGKLVFLSPQVRADCHSQSYVCIALWRRLYFHPFLLAYLLSHPMDSLQPHSAAEKTETCVSKLSLSSEGSVSFLHWYEYLIKQFVR